MTLDECCRILEIESSYSRETLRQAYKTLATVWHPDRFAGNERLRRDAEEKLRRINIAYDVLNQHLDDLESEESPEDVPPEEDFSEANSEEFNSWENSDRQPDKYSEAVVVSTETHVPRQIMFLAGAILGAITGGGAGFLTGVQPMWAMLLGSIIGGVVGTVTRQPEQSSP